MARLIKMVSGCMGWAGLSMVLDAMTAAQGLRRYRSKCDIQAAWFDNRTGMTHYEVFKWRTNVSDILGRTFWLDADHCGVVGLKVKTRYQHESHIPTSEQTSQRRTHDARSSLVRPPIIGSRQRPSALKSQNPLGASIPLGVEELGTNVPRRDLTAIAQSTHQVSLR
ncbi:hypothetical protein FA15DRAFT_365740 [Coprinopsis marcescibilis]|uniref:Uncharacterized protein n=1 Tax=Coprinopsis marcescibilis TaxID=230819 RepID=A0A5C3KB27_COPMA|nr:hypothetical protein FA15DRAFT_365740 [Coprinopsis marcescibilis]